ncbi:MAG: 4,5-DOPA dioxygenase extradiol [Povalibacter sp.]
MNTSRMPSVFVGHGSPMNAIETNAYTDAWRKLGESFPHPSAILAISAHWYVRETAITAAAKPKTIHDFRGFPPELFAFNYPAPGAVALVPRVQQLLAPTKVSADEEWGLDHGTWSVLAHMYSQANIPVAQLSIDASLPAQAHYDLGRQLGALRDEGVMIFASGNIVHDLRRLNWDSAAVPYAWAREFNDSVREALARGDHRYAIDYEKGGAAANASIPTPEHYLPLLYVLGASRPADVVSFPTDGLEMGSISMLSVLNA